MEFELNSTYNLYQPPDLKIWTGRTDDIRDRESYRWHQIIRPLELFTGNVPDKTVKNPSFCLIGFCCDKGVEENNGRIGAADAPYAIRKELTNLPDKGYDPSILFDGGNILYKGDLAASQATLEAAVRHILELGLFPLIMGGGHEVALGSFSGVLGSKKEKAGIINFDAHFDLRPLGNGPSSGNMFSSIEEKCQADSLPFNYFCLGIQESGNTASLFQRAERLGVQYIKAAEINSSPAEVCFPKLSSFMNKLDNIYITVCSDVFSSAYAPGVSSPQPFGLHPEKVMTLLKYILNTGKTVCFDIAEVSPCFDDDNRTAKLAAIFIFALVNTLCGVI